MEVRNLPSFTSKVRPGRDTLFYKIFGFPFEDLTKK